MLFVVSNHKIIIIWPSPLILIIFLFKIITTLELIDKKNLGPTGFLNFIFFLFFKFFFLQNLKNILTKTKISLGKQLPI